MRQKIKHTGKRALSIVLSLMMIMSTLAVGIISVDAATISYWTVSGWQTNGGLASVNWSASNDTYKISGASGSVTYTNINNNAANTETIYFRMLAHMSDSKKYVASSTTETTLTAGVRSSALTWTECPSNYSKIDSLDKQLIFKPTKKYVTFTISQSGLNNYVTVTESDTKPGETPAPTKITTLPTVSKAKNTLIFNSNTSAKAQSAWLWTANNGDGKCYALDGVGTVSSQYLSTHERLDTSSPNAIPFKYAYTDGASPDWNNRLTTDNNHVGSNSTLISSVDGDTSIIDGNYYVKFTNTSQDSSHKQWTVFSHIGATFSVDNAEVEPGTTVKISATANKGTLRKAKIGAGNDYFTYVVKYPDGSYYRIGDANTTETSVTFAPEAAGTYTIMGYVSDPFKFETVKATEVTLTVEVPVTPLAKPTISTNKAYIGSGETATISVSNTSDYTGKGTVTYTLYKGDAVEASNTTGSFSVSSAGTYKVKATSSNAAYTESEFSNSVTVNAKTPLAKPTISTNKTYIGSTESATISVSNTSAYTGKGVTYSLYKGNSNTAVASNTTGSFSVNSAGTYKVKATSSNAAYTESEFSNSVAVNAKTVLPKPVLSVSPTTIDSKDVTFTITFTIDNFSSYSGATPKFTLYKEGQTSPVQQNIQAESTQVSGLSLTDGANKYYVVLSYDTSTYECANTTSDYAVVTKTTPKENYKVNFGSNDGTMGTVSAKDASNNAVTSGNTVLEGTSVTFTAAPKTGYEVEGWYSNSECTTKIPDTGTSTTYTATVNAETNVYVKFKEKVAISYAIVGTLGSSEVKTFDGGVKFGADNTVQITYDGNSNSNHFRIADNQGNFYGTASTNSEYIEDNTSEANAFSSVSRKTKYEEVYPFYFNTKATYTVHIKTDTNGYVSKVWVTTVKSFALEGGPGLAVGSTTANWPSDYNGANLKFTDNKLTVTVADTSKNCEFRFIDSSGVRYGSNNNGGVPVSSGSTYTTTANNTSVYKFNETGTYTIEITDTSSPIKFKVTKGSSSSGLCLMDNATSTKIGDFVNGTFTKNIPAGTTYSLYIKDGSTNYYAGGTINDETSEHNFYTRDDAPYATFNATIGGDYTFTAVKRSDGGYKLTIVAPEQTGFAVYAKNGTVTGAQNSGGEANGSMSDVGKTILIDERYKDKVVSANNRYEVYRANPGETLSVQTIIKKEFLDLNYFVAGYVINGETYEAVNKGNGEYRTFYTVPDDLGMYEGIQITPVYFITGKTGDSSYMKVYVDASQVQNHWGNEIASFSYYYNGGADRAAEKADGVWPGQPMLKDSNGKYYTYVPKQYKNHDISGVAFNNYSEDTVSKLIYNDENETVRQSFDFNDLEYINKYGCDIAQFTIAYRESTDNVSNTAKIFQASDLIEVDGVKKGVKLSSNPTADAELSIDEFDYAHNHGTGWNDLFTYDKERANILGGKADTTKQALRVVSCGNVETDFGQWSTLWAVYDENRKFVTYGVPSDFIPRADGNNTAAYNAIQNYSNSTRAAGYYADAPVRITYGGTGDQEKRADGRWTYTKSSDLQATVNVGVQYSDSAVVTDTTVWTDDINGVDGHTGSTAYIDGKTTVTYPDRAQDGTLIATPGNGWIFHGWYKETINEQTSLPYYEFLSDELSMTLTADSNYNIVARFIPVGEGSISISHSKYSGPGAQGGMGNYYISATLTDTDGNIQKTVEKTDKPITFNNVSTEFSSGSSFIDVTLYTECSGENTFLYFYEGVDGGYQIIAPETNDWGYGEKTGTYNFRIQIDDLVKDNKFVINTFNFYSDIAKVSADVTLNYKYRDRFGSMVTYVVKTTLTDDQMAANEAAGHNKYYLSPEYISSHAPYIDDLYNNCNWNITEQTITREGTAATVVAQQNEKLLTAKVDASGDGKTIETVENIHYNSLLTKQGTTEFFTSTAADFKYWVVYILGTEDTDKPVEITRCYSNTFNFRITQDCYIKAVTVDDGKTLAISEAKYTHNIYTNPDGSETDYLYADFIVSYTGTDHILLNSETGDEEELYRTGIIVEACFDGANSVIDKNNLKTGTDGKIDLNQYQYTSDLSAIEAAVVSSATSSSYDCSDGTTHRLKKFDLDNQYYNNYNKQEYYIRYSNNDKNTTCVMKAYYYVYKVDQAGNIIEGSIELSEATYYCLYDIANATNATN